MKKDEALRQPDPSIMVSKERAANMLGISRRMLNELIRSQQIPTIRLSSVAVLLSIEDLHQFVRDRRSMEVPPPPHQPKRRVPKKKAGKTEKPEAKTEAKPEKNNFRL